MNADKHLRAIPRPVGKYGAAGRADERHRAADDPEKGYSALDDQKAREVMLELVATGQLTDPESARGKLLQTAAHLFRSKGYERTTVRDLASAVGIQSGSIFHHFKSKDEILRSVMEETILYNTALMRAALADAEDLRERVLGLIRCELQSIMGGTGEAMAVLVYEWRSLSAEGQAYILGLRDIYEQMWLDVLGGAAGRLLPGRSVHPAALPHRRAVLDHHLVPSGRTDESRPARRGGPGAGDQGRLITRRSGGTGSSAGGSAGC